VAADREETLPERGPNLFGQIVTGSLEKLAARAPACDPAAAAALHDEAVACQRAIEAWEETRPSDDERSAMRARLGALSAQIAKL
jgi:hypothetical protein